MDNKTDVFVSWNYKRNTRSNSTREYIHIIDEEIFGEDVSEGRTRVPFMEEDGGYWGLPVDSEAAIEELERLLIKYKAQHLVFVQSSFWWFNYYAAFKCVRP